MSFLSSLYHRNKKLIWIFIAVCSLAIINLLFHKEKDPLADYKKQVKTEFPAEAKQILDKAILHIEKNNMRELFKLMAHNNPMAFSENYENGLFAQPDFCPVRITDDHAVKFARSKHDHVIVKLYSEKRNSYYLVSLQKIKNSYKIYSIMQDVPRV